MVVDASNWSDGSATRGLKSTSDPTTADDGDDGEGDGDDGDDNDGSDGDDDDDDDGDGEGDKAVLVADPNRATDAVDGGRDWSLDQAGASDAGATTASRVAAELWGP